MASPTDPKAPLDSSARAPDAAAQAPTSPPKRPASPPPRPSRPPPIARPKDAGGLFADLPDLPKMAASAPKRNLTLVGMLQATRSKSSGRGRYVLAGVGVVMLVAIVSSALYRRTLVKHFVAKRPVVQTHKLAPIAAVLTSQQKAALALAAGSKAYSDRDYGKAVASFEEALNLDPTLADAHRSLGIVHADLHDEAEAIAHYQTYIEMVPHGRDSARVKKIIDDYALAHAPPPPPPAPPVAPAKKDPKARKSKLHRRP